MTDAVGVSTRVWSGAQLRGAPVRLLIAWGAVVLGAVCLSALALAMAPMQPSYWVRLGVLAILCLVFEEISAQVRKLRAMIRSGPRQDMTSVWTLAGTLALPPAYAALLVVTILFTIWLRLDRVAGSFVYRKVYTAATIVFACFAAGVVLREFATAPPIRVANTRTAVAVVLAILVYTAMQRLLVFIAAYLSGARPGLSVLGTWVDNSLELATLCLGAMVGVLVFVQPWLCVLVLLPMVLLERGALVKELELAAATDVKTGLLNADAWRRAAIRELARSEREHSSTGLMIIDLDHFKDVNDVYGHLVGDVALLTVGRRLTDELRQYDVIGRFGGEEFVALLPRIERADALATAERVRTAIAGIVVQELDGARAGDGQTDMLSASVGLALYPEHGATADDLLVAADAALYRAKRAGRNLVMLADDPTATDEASASAS